MDFLVDIISTNESVDYVFVGYCLLGYIVLLWLAVSSWAARDAYRRYGNEFIAGGWFAAVFVFNFPALLFYMVIRPDEIFAAYGQQIGGGVNVPIANFVGKDGEFLMGIQMKIDSAQLTDATRDMKISLDWESDDPKKQLVSEALAGETSNGGQKVNINRLRKVLNSFTKQAKQVGPKDKSLANKPVDNKSIDNQRKRKFKKKRHNR